MSFCLGPLNVCLAEQALLRITPPLQVDSDKCSDDGQRN